MEAVQITGVQISLLAVMFTAGAALWALYRLVTTGAESVRKELLAEIDKQAALAAKSIHDKANAATAITVKIEAELERLKRETVRREDMAAIENRLTAMFAKIETKVDAVGEKLAGFAALEKQVLALDTRLENALRRQVTVDRPPH
jgi:hypothetical protein